MTATTSRKIGDVVYIITATSRIVEVAGVETVKTWTYVARVRIDGPGTFRSITHCCPSTCRDWMCWRDDGNTQFMSEPECEMFDSISDAEVVMSQRKLTHDGSQ